MPYLFAFLLLFLSACADIPAGIQAVDGFQLQRYLGKWYEIARLDHSFEKGLSAVTAEYSLREDGGVTVLNSGYDGEKQQRVSAEGKAYFVGSSSQGRLKVSFFGPFYAGYNIIALDKKHYRYAMIAGPSLDYLWILSRTPKLEKAVLEKLLQQAEQMGFATEQLIYVSQPL